MTNITLFSKENCPQCKMTKRFLTDNKISYQEHNITLEPQYIDYLKDNGHMAVPIVEADGLASAIVGFRPDQLKQLA